MSYGDPALPTCNEELPTVELVFFGPTAEEVIGTPADALIATQASVGDFLPTKITLLYGRQYELRVSMSPGSLQRSMIAFQVDSVIGAVDASAMPPPLPVGAVMPPPSTLPPQSMFLISACTIL